VRQSNLILLTLLTVLIVSCNSNNKTFIQTEDQYETIDDKKQIVSKTIKTLRTSDSLPIATLTKVFNFNDDIRIKYLTGLSKEDGLQNYLLDSIYYDKLGNDTLKKTFVCLDNNWQEVQTFHKIFRADKQVSYLMIERPYNKDNYFKKEIYYNYNNAGNILTETEVECHLKNDCDSILKKVYVYNSTGKLDSTIFYTWKNSEWSQHKKKNGR
jgi:type VI protein secretion system component VasK